MQRIAALKVISHDAWPGIRNFTGFTSNRSTHYILDYGDFKVQQISYILYILCMSSYQMKFQFKNWKICWRILIIHSKMKRFYPCTTARGRLIFVLFANIIIFRCANIGQLLVVAQIKSPNLRICQQTIKIHLKFWKYLNWKFIYKFHSIKNITWLLYYVNNNSSFFATIWSNEVSNYLVNNICWKRKHCTTFGSYPNVNR